MGSLTQHDKDVFSRQGFIKEEIDGGQAVISGGFVGSAGIKEAQSLVNDLNLGALPVPIQLISTQTIGATPRAVTK